MAVAVALAGHPVAAVTPLGVMLRTWGIVAVTVLVVGLVGAWPAVVNAAVGLLVVRYAVALAVFDLSDPAAPLVAAGVMVLIELAHGAIDGFREPAAARWGRAALVAAIAVVAGLVVQLGATLPVTHGMLMQAAGVGAAVAALGLVVVLLRGRA